MAFQIGQFISSFTGIWQGEATQVSKLATNNVEASKAETSNGKEFSFLAPGSKTSDTKNSTLGEVNFTHDTQSQQIPDEIPFQAKSTSYEVETEIGAPEIQFADNDLAQTE